MTALFVDTSALAKRYLTEVGSAWAVRVMDLPSGNVIIIADVTTVEVPSLMARRVREGVLSAVARTSLSNVFLLHARSQYITLSLDNNVLMRARALVGRHPLRALDAIQLASAQESEVIFGETITFVSSDRNLLAAATAEGFTTDDPLAHP